MGEEVQYGQRTCFGRLRENIACQKEGVLVRVVVNRGQQVAARETVSAALKMRVAGCSRGTRASEAAVGNSGEITGEVPQKCPRPSNRKLVLRGRSRTERPLGCTEPRRTCKTYCSEWFMP